jgi:large subunit ribosomal protein L22
MPETKATLRYLRTSATKVREVLDLIRGLEVEEARHVLRFSERGAARDVLKVLNSAAANADHTLNIPVDELYVSLAFADEGPTIKRWRPRARGRATRIRKRTSHITIVVARLSDEQLQARRRREAAAPGQRRRSVIPGRRRKAEEQAGKATGPAKAGRKGSRAPEPSEPEAAPGEESVSDVEPGPSDQAEIEAENVEIEAGVEAEASPEEEEDRAARYASLGREAPPDAGAEPTPQAEPAKTEEEEGK